jgi:hypothetical protein
MGQDARKFAGVLPDGRSELFLARGLDRWKQLEIAGEIRFYAQVSEAARGDASLDSMHAPSFTHPQDGRMCNEWIKPREYSFMNAAGKVFHEIAYSQEEVDLIAEMHKAVKYRETPLSDDRAIAPDTIWQMATPSRKIS